MGRGSGGRGGAPPRITSHQKIFIQPFFRDSRRAKLQCMYDSLSRKQLDDHNSEGSVDLWQEVCDDYNSETYAPMSFTFPDLHSKFRIAISLALPDNAMPMNPENGQRVIKDLNGKFKKGNTSWKASGNDKKDEATRQFRTYQRGAF